MRVGGGGGGGGTLRVELEAEDTVTEGIGPAAMGSAQGFADGWTLRFERFLVSIGGIAVADEGGAAMAVPASWASGHQVFDLRNGSGTELFTLPSVEARRYSRVSFESRVVGGETRFAERVSMTERVGMQGASLWLTAVATRGPRTVRIDWKFREGWGYRECQGPEGRPGAGTVVREGGVTPLRLTIHGDHWVWLNLGESGGARFDAIANADTMAAPYRGDGDGTVTLEELDRVPLASVPAADGSFNPNGRPVTTLGDFMRWSTGTLGHIDGDGVCGARRL